MKKIITLLFSFGVFATSFAQYNHGQNNRDDQYANSSNGNYKDRDHFDKGNYFERDRNFQIEKINRDFDYQIRAIQSDRYMRRHEKREQIRNAEIERSRKIQMVNARFNRWERGHGNYDNDRNNHDNDRNNNQDNWKH